MVKERKKFNTLDLVSKYSLLETGNYQHKINALLNEICDLFDSKWIYVENKLDNNINVDYEQLIFLLNSLKNDKFVTMCGGVLDLMTKHSST